MGQLKMMISMGAVALAGATAFGIGASVSSTPSMMSRGGAEKAFRIDTGNPALLPGV